MDSSLVPTGENRSEDEVRLPAGNDESMPKLWDEGALDPRSLRRGDVIGGTIVSIDRDGIMVDIGAKSEGIVPAHEVEGLSSDFLAQLHVGDEVLVYVVQPENQEGQVILSLDRARAEKGWRTLGQLFETGESFEAGVIGYNKGGLIVSVDGVRGFVPTSQIAGMRPDLAAEAQGESRLASMVGKELRLKVIEINRRRNRLILSERAAIQEWRSHRKDKLLTELEPGQIRTGTITSICSFGVFVDIGGADGLVHLSELSWDRVEDPKQVFNIGDEVEVYVMSVDQEAKKIALSIRRARTEPWAEVAKKYEVGQIVSATVTKLANFGAFARIEGGVEGLIHVSELSDRRIGHPREVVKEGEALTVKIVRIEPERHRLGLSLKQAQEGSLEQ